MSDVTFCMRENRMDVHQKRAEPWRVTLVDTGENTMTGGRLKKVSEYLQDEESFCFTYGDGVGSVDITALLQFHHSHGLQATMTAVYPPGRFGAVDIDQQKLVSSFKEKPKGDGGMINGGFFVLSPDVLKLIDNDQSPWEEKPLQTLSDQKQLAAYSHEGFWQPMDTLRDKNNLEALWQSGEAPWKVWE
jgi:glucose-1-phosphate cytidylyltransferase